MDDSIAMVFFFNFYGFSMAKLGESYSCFCPETSRSFWFTTGVIWLRFLIPSSRSDNLELISHFPPQKIRYFTRFGIFVNALTRYALTRFTNSCQLISSFSSRDQKFSWFKLPVRIQTPFPSANRRTISLNHNSAEFNSKAETTWNGSTCSVPPRIIP